MAPNEEQINDWLARSMALRTKYNIVNGLWDKLKVVETWFKIAKKCFEMLGAESYTYESLKAL